ncbi:MAG: hypothetical protein NZ551_04670 [Microscillaceae bacterium]|nr:hypothetical protein [Microscillaceae bacterium]MDW8460486.1 hypothetical protein [Cytophagales bacterium]
MNLQLLLFTWLFLLISSFYARDAKTQGRVIGDILDPYQQNTDLLYNSQAQKQIAGSPFETEWAIGTFIDTENNLSPRQWLRYNAFNDELYCKNDKGQESIVPKEKVQSFSFTNPITKKEEKYVKIMLSGKTRTGATYLKLWYASNKVKLWEKVRKIVEKAPSVSTNSAGYGTIGNENDKFVNNNLILIEFANQPLQFVEKKPKKFAEMFGEKALQIEEFMKKEKIKLRDNPEEYVKVLRYYDSLR